MDRTNPGGDVMRCSHVPFTGEETTYMAHEWETDDLVAECVRTLAHRGCPQRGKVWGNPHTGNYEAQCPLDTWLKAMRKTGVEDLHANKIEAHFLGTNPPLDRTENDILPAMDALIAKKPATITHNAKDGQNGDKVEMTGKETLIGLFGSRGAGKTLGASWVLAHLGGRMAYAYEFARPIENIEALTTISGVLVIDQLGREYARSDWARCQIEEVIVKRHARNRLTLLVGNTTPDRVKERYEGIVIDRFAENGAMLVFYGKSRRGATG